MIPVLTERVPVKTYLMFSSPPGPTGCEFIEAEDSEGKSLELGRWVKIGKLYALELDGGSSKLEEELLVQIGTVAAARLQLDVLNDEARSLKSEVDKWKAEAHKQAGQVFSQASAVASDLKLLHDLRIKARECVMSQGEILCDACLAVTRELRADPNKRPCPHSDSYGDRQCGAVGNEPCKTWRGDTILDGSRHEERDA